ncbi:GATOR complex protein MIOS [Aricia agestis]|uniref:GATOR complex protein MIOS n=1 Tax=Aricia agestis TaxID=91739 RepID=UPI001C202844|nr:GATOR complex protein MIOS [Aricia agestis]
MASNKLDVLWSPIHDDKFIVWGQDITLYEVSPLEELENKTCTPLSATSGATVIASQSANGVRCVDISAIPEADPILALGHASGKITLTCPKQNYDPLGLVGKEFVPRCLRPCNSLAWNKTETNLLAVGMEKHKTDNCIAVWDVQMGSDEFPTASTPVIEVGMGESTHSVAWCGFAPRTLLATVSLKQIKLFDLREGGGGASAVAGWGGGGREARAWGGVAAEARGWAVAARGDAGAAVWDARALRRPLLDLPMRPPRKIQWSPTRRNLLMTLQRDAHTLRLHDIQQTADWRADQPYDIARAEEVETGTAVAVEREVCGAGAGAGAPLAAFAAHPARRARVLTLTAAGVVREWTVCERVSLAWAGGALVWAGGGALRRATPPADYAARARQRALADYGLKSDLWQNADLVDDEALSNMWLFLALSKSLFEDGCIRNSPWKHPGVCTVLKSPGDGYRSEAVAVLIPDLPSRKVTVYRSPERTRALQLCGWGWGWESAGAGVERAEAEGTPCRAAALAAFHLRMRAALDVLGRARAPALRVAALALAPPAPAQHEERLWRDALEAAAPALPDAYLRATLRFLAAACVGGPPDYSPVLAETEMRLEDRVAFACVYLADGALHEYARTLADELARRGDLAGLALTGVSPAGLALLQRWLDESGDVQTAALVAARCCPPELLRDARVQGWLEGYRALLDGWRLWWARCLLDTWVSAGGATGAAGARGGGAGVACTYCGKPVATPHARARPAFARLAPPAAKMKISSCPNCRKPLPRCGVCSLHLGTGAVGGGAGAGAGGGGAGAQFGGWFSWCVACRHGGHAAHLLEWFSEHAECPVSSCTCRCAALDPPDVPNALDPAPATADDTQAA